MPLCFHTIAYGVICW